MITVAQGRPGMGKTVWLVSEILRWTSKGVHVYTNVTIKFKEGSKLKEFYHEIHSLEDIVGLRQGKIILDEVQTYLNSRNWDKLDIRFQLLLQQHRKRGLDIIGATQSIKRADVVFRELVQVFYDIRKVVTFKIFGKAFGFFLFFEYDPDSMESQTRSYDSVAWPSVFFADPIVFEAYDTTQEYEIPDPVGMTETFKYVHVKKTIVDKQLVSRKMEV